MLRPRTRHTPGRTATETMWLDVQRIVLTLGAIVLLAELGQAWGWY